MPVCVLCKRHFTLESDLREHLRNCPSRQGHEREHEDDSSLLTAGLVGLAVGVALSGSSDDEPSSSPSSDPDSGCGSCGGGDLGGGGASESFGD